MSDHVRVGRVQRAHGLGGEVSVAIDSNRPERVEPGSVLYLNGDPEVVESSRRHHGKWLIHFKGFRSRTAAEAIQGAEITGEPIDDPNALWYHEMVGSQVQSVDGVSRGKVKTILENPASDLLQLEGGALVPLRFVDSFSDGVIVVDVPEGLFDL